MHSFMLVGFDTVPTPLYACGSGSGATHRCGPHGADKISLPNAPETRREKINTNVKLNRSTQSLGTWFNSGSDGLGQTTVWLTEGVASSGRHPQ